MVSHARERQSKVIFRQTISKDHSICRSVDLLLHSPLFIDNIIVELVTELEIVVGLIVELGQQSAHRILVPPDAAHDLFAAWR